MITDKLTTFAKGTALNTGAAGTYLVGDVIPLSVARDVGNGNPIYLVMSVAVAATSGGSATAEFALASDASAAIATDGSATVHIKSDQFAVADMDGGMSLLTVALPLEGLPYEGFLGILQTTGTAAFTGGEINAFLTQTPDAWKAMPSETGYVA